MGFAILVTLSAIGVGIDLDGLSISALTDAALGKSSPHSLNGRFVVMTVDLRPACAAICGRAGTGIKTRARPLKKHFHVFLTVSAMLKRQNYRFFLLLVQVLS